MKVLTVLIEGFEEVEALTPVDYLIRSGVNVDLATPSKDLFVTSSHNIKIMADKNLNEICFCEYDAIFLPGGPTTLEYMKEEKLLDAILKFNKENKLIFAICAAPSIFSMLGLLKGKKATCYKTFRKYLDENGAIYVDDEKVVREGNIITARSVNAAQELSFEVVEYMLGKEKLEELKDQIMYKR